jgi:MFS transporter, FHS family, Na+ dependent glucose transporter 1
MINKLISLTRTDAIRRTFGYYSLFICLGLSIAIIGPTLPSLANQTHASLGELGLVFLIWSMGYTLGTYLSGRIYDRTPGHTVLGVAQICAAILLMLIPAARWLWLLLAILACKGIAEGFINTGSNALLVWTHGEKVAPFMNGLQFFFGVGAFISPLFVALALGTSTSFHWVYWGIGIFALLAGLRMLTLKNSPSPVRAQKDDSGRIVSQKSYYPLVFVATLLLFFYVGAEITFSGWVYTYAVALKLVSSEVAAYLTSGFWLTFTISRLVAVPVSTRFAPKQVLLVTILGCLAILAVAMLIPGSQIILWIMSIGLGLSMGPIWPAAFTLAGQSFPLTGKISSIVLLGDSSGTMVLPWLVGRVIETNGPSAMLVLVFGSLLLSLVTFLGMLFLRTKQPGVQVPQ